MVPRLRFLSAAPAGRPLFGLFAIHGGLLSLRKQVPVNAPPSTDRRPLNCVGVADSRFHFGSFPPQDTALLFRVHDGTQINNITSVTHGSHPPGWSVATSRHRDLAWPAPFVPLDSSSGSPAVRQHRVRD
jgi:hypothetical protein